MKSNSTESEEEIMSRYEIRISELTDLGYKLDQAKEIAKAEEAERQTNALERIADALVKQNDGHVIEVDLDSREDISKLAAAFEEARKRAYEML